MNRHWKQLAAVATALWASGAMAQATVGQPAPAFSGVDAAGKPVALADFKGKYVVLEWTNPECPFVKKHYDSGNLPATQKAATAKGVVWVSVQTGADGGAQGRSELQAWQASKQSVPTATVIDANGQIGRSYRAATTPHLYIVDPQGKVIYTGGIDSKASANPADIASATNYVNQALGEALAGKPVSQPVTKPYGCSVKYPSGA
jgi:cytochrome oxidase Cu insertion factor (SCO1/SenC/PrrC family)